MRSYWDGPFVEMDIAGGRSPAIDTAHTTRRVDSVHKRRLGRCPAIQIGFRNLVKVASSEPDTKEAVWMRKTYAAINQDDENYEHTSTMTSSYKDVIMTLTVTLMSPSNLHPDATDGDTMSTSNLCPADIDTYVHIKHIQVIPTVTIMSTSNLCPADTDVQVKLMSR
ncbi:hypothetical protein LSAT2_002780 [Lamellibrachia satsuma]|nr:hypothetical protein LSAT2_002780 [Lamellibrachia satsuma]